MLKVVRKKGLEELLVKKLRERKYGLEELAKELSVSKKTVLRKIQKLENLGYAIIREKDGFLISGGLFEDNYLVLKSFESQGVFGIVSDTHLCSKHERLDALHDFYNFLKREGVKYVFHAGDLVEGLYVYQGQINELKVFGVDEQAEYFVKNYPSLEGLITVYITGNHDLKMFQKTGVDIGKLIERYRKDLRYVGQYYGRVITPQGVKIDLIHPAKGSAYALSYHPQKYVEQLRGGCKPNVLVWGHQHDLIYMFYRNIHLFKAGTFQDQTEFMLRRGLSANVGGWLVEYKFEDGEVEWLKALLKAYYR